MAHNGYQADALTVPDLSSFSGLAMEEDLFQVRPFAECISLSATVPSRNAVAQADGATATFYRHSVPSRGYTALFRWN